MKATSYSLASFHILMVALIVVDGSIGTVTNAPSSPLEAPAAPNCPSSVAPCICNGPAWNSLTEIICNRVSVATVQTMFGKLTNTNTISALTLTPNAKDTLIPANVIGKQKIATLTLNCPSRFTNIKIDRSAFASSSQTVKSVSISNCDLSLVDWSFLTNFTKMKSFSVASSDNFHRMFYTFPTATLTSLNSITLLQVRNLNGFSNHSLMYPAIVSQGLTTVTIKYCYDFGNDAIEHLFTKWVTPSSDSTLTELYLSGNSLTQIPLDIPKFKQLYNFQLFENMVPWTIQSNAFNIQLPANSRSTLDLDFSEIESIEPNAFQGDYSDAQVLLYGNNLEFFDQAVFMEMLSQMDGGSGYLDVGQNPFDCDYYQCELQWLIADNPQFLDVMWSAQCANGTYFYDLDPDVLAFPDGTPCLNNNYP